MAPSLHTINSNNTLTIFLLSVPVTLCFVGLETFFQRRNTSLRKQNNYSIDLKVKIAARSPWTPRISESTG